MKSPVTKTFSYKLKKIDTGGQSKKIQKKTLFFTWFVSISHSDINHAKKGNETKLDMHSL
jgi:hypothetical protein